MSPGLPLRWHWYFSPTCGVKQAQVLYGHVVSTRHSATGGRRLCSEGRAGSQFMAQMQLSGNRHAWCFKMSASMVTTVEGLSKLSQIKKGKENPNEAFDRQLKTGLIANPCEACHTKKNTRAFFSESPSSHSSLLHQKKKSSCQSHCGKLRCAK